MITYSTNWMGPCGLWWYEKHNLLSEPYTRKTRFGTIETRDILEHYSGGRIDVYGTDDPYPRELGLPIMRSEDYNKFSDWLDNYKTEKVKSLEEILEDYYAEGNAKLRFKE